MTSYGHLAYATWIGSRLQDFRVVLSCLLVLVRVWCQVQVNADEDGV